MFQVTVSRALGQRELFFFFLICPLGQKLKKAVHISEVSEVLVRLWAECPCRTAAKPTP